MHAIRSPHLVWDHSDEKSSCGVGFITRKDGRATHDVIDMAREALCSVPHRGGISALGIGDGGGVSMDLSRRFFRSVTGRPDLELGRFCVGNFFLPESPAAAARATRLIERTMHDRGFTDLCVRDVPVDPSVLRPASAAAQLPIRQWVFAAPDPCPDPADLDHLVQQALLHIESIAYTSDEFAGLYPLSLSARTQVLKGRLSSNEVVDYFTDLADPDHRVHTLYFHTRFSTNTDPHPTMAQPFRLLAHNGELNTDKKNRIAQVTAAAASGRTISRPPGQSDSSRLDQTVAARVVSERVDLVTAIVSMMPPAWENDTTLAPEVRAMFEYFSLYEEKNDGPAAVVFGDGTVIGARLDRLGLRPLRTVETADYLCAFSEAGQISLPPERVIARGRVSAGGMIYYDHREHRSYTTEQAYAKLAAARDYPSLLNAARVELSALAPQQSSDTSESDDSPTLPCDDPTLTDHQRFRAYHLDQESLRYFVDPMIDDGVERVSAMGFGNAINALTNREPSVARYFSQRFAQVTNPPLDSIREADGMSLRVALGARPRISEIDTATTHPHRQIVIPTPILDAAALDVLLAQAESPVRVFDATFALPEVSDGSDTASADNTAAQDDATALVSAVERVCTQVVEFASATGGIAVLSDRAIRADRAALPMIFLVSAVNQRLIASGARLSVSLVADSGQIESSHHLAAVLGFGAAAAHPHSVARRATRSSDQQKATAGFARWAAAATKSLMKTMGRVGLCTVESYIGGEFFEPNFLDTSDPVLAEWFPTMRSPAGGAALADVVDAIAGAHRAAMAAPAASSDKDLPLLGLFKERADGAGHSFGVAAVRGYGEMVSERLQFATATVNSVRADEAGAADLLRLLTLGDLDGAFGETAQLYSSSSYDRLTDAEIDAFTVTDAYRAFVDDIARTRAERPSTVRDVLNLRRADTSRRLTDVQPAHEITATFASGAMSHGALVAQAHEAIAHGTNMVGALSNSGEGGEHYSRYGTLRASRIKQFASGRFGIWAGYLADPMLTELEIKIGQGAKPGEGGQLPAPKVTVEIAAARGGTPGVELVSPPPHHDTYSIEDLAQLIHDCKAARVRVIVKLVSSEGIGTIAVGVAKAGADVINVAGNTGGTGAASVTSLRYAGRAAEIGLAEVHQALCAHGLREKVVLRASGAHQTGRDVVVSALLGADSFEFGTAALMMMGCVMAKNCNIKCPAGLTTNPELFDGDPRAMAQYLLNVAHDVRRILADLALPDLSAARGRTDLLVGIEHPAIVGRLDTAPLLARVDREAITDPVYLEADFSVDNSLLNQVRDALFDEGAESVVTVPAVLGNRNKSVGAQLAVDIERMLNYTAPDHPDSEHPASENIDLLPAVYVDERGRRYLAPDSVTIPTSGSAGLSYGAFCNDGLRLEHTGTCNDGVGKSMSGGTVVVRSPGGGSPAEGGNVLIGNFALFGATGGRLFVEGEAGDRFAVRNSGATAVVEGIGEFGCEYMTNGAVLNIGGFGRGLGNGMSGGFLYQYDPACVLADRISSDSVLVGAITGVDDPLAPIHHHAVHLLLEMHAEATGSALANRLLENWETERHYISYAMPRALVSHQDAPTLLATLGHRALVDELSTSIATDQVRALKRHVRNRSPILDGLVPAYGHTDDATMYRLLNAFTVFHLAREVAQTRMRRSRSTVVGADSRSEQLIARAARNLVLTEDFDLVTRVGTFVRDILAEYDEQQIAALISAKRIDDYKRALAARNVRSVDAPATYGWIMHQDNHIRDVLGSLPDFDALFASRTVPTVVEALAAATPLRSVAADDITPLSHPKAG
ncbi:glutamate synthase-related protein [Gordonia jacobaea]|uniref:glutamate synthase-related protein n=1 Tax=Gordonia jacobaea TaxID=122202 RepID=UPI003D728E52